MAARSRTAKFYASNPEARAKKARYDTKYGQSPARRKYRAKLNAERKRRGIYGKGGKDVSHVAGGGTRLESPSKNRARQGANGKSTKAPRRKKK